MEEPNQNRHDQLVLFINGRKVIERNADPETMLLTFIRRKLGLTGTKLGCSEGGCGACTVMMSKFDPHSNRIIHQAINACLAPLCSLHHCAITTVEGIGSVGSKLHPVQERIAKAHGSQCGFCTPGLVMSMYTLLRKRPQPSMQDIEDAFQGNLCRCTGYRPIMEGFRTFTKCFLLSDSVQPLFDPEEFLPLDPTQDIIFPPELMTLSKEPVVSLRFRGERVLWVQPSSLTELLELKAAYPEARLVVGNTEVGIEMKFKNQLYPVILSPTNVQELRNIQFTENGMECGAAVTLAELGEVLREEVEKLPNYRTEIFQAVLEQLRWFAGRQIRNVAVRISTVILITKMYILFKEGKRVVKMDEKFFTGYRKTILRSEEILLSIEIPYTKKYFSAFKQSPRREDDIATVTCGMNVVFGEGSNTVQDIKLSYGGMAPVTLLATDTCRQLIGRQWGEDLMEDACSLLAEEMSLSPSAPGGMVAYRRTLTISLFFKFFLTVQRKLAQENLSEGVRSDYESATELFHQDPPTGAQIYQAVPPGQSADDVVGRPMMHLSALKQATGEAVYCDDIPHYENELYLALVTSTKAHAHIISIETAEAMAVPGVVAFISAKDIPGSNKTGPVVSDETVFADNKVTCVGHIIGAVVADTQAHAQRAAKAVKISYEELQPVIVSIQSEVQSEVEWAAVIHDLDWILGEIHIGGQEHFYLETNCALAVPRGEDGEMELLVSTQAATKTQVIRLSLGVPASHVVCRVKRMGGGFGGKESRSTILCCLLKCKSLCFSQSFSEPHHAQIRNYSVRKMNLYQQGGITPFNQSLEQFTIDRCWDECITISDFSQRRARVELYNKQHRWTKRGLSIIPTKFGISFTATFLNQAGALVHIYTDGSVLITHGGTEMGQGLHTKMIQIASRTLEIPTSKIHISETSTNTVPNTSPTAASASSDLNGMAIYNACQTLLQRLKPYKTSKPKGNWEDWVFLNLLILFCRTPDLGYSFETNSGRPFNYFTYGVTASEVEIDCLTGSHKNLHTSIVMDVGKSLNPALDIGQVEGAFMQGVGLFTLEELRYSPQGYLYTRGPGMYKIPAFGDIPTQLKVSLLRDAPNERAIFSSKAVGEPPLFLAASIFYAIKDAISAARAESGLSGPFRLDSPATPERIRNACQDKFTKLCPPPEAGTYTPWDMRV
uniref:Xanthine dehydrogenase/oxidase n=1 Tax=Astyanax mexicanus TaxID=7994 RepID=A0A8B9RD02_ASTMX